MSVRLIRNGSDREVFDLVVEQYGQPTVQAILHEDIVLLVVGTNSRDEYTVNISLAEE
jgi:hypothetical protein